ncbi:hypothetical protein KIL84_003765, partial [Mauremys mutica]
GLSAPQPFQKLTKKLQSECHCSAQTHGPISVQHGPCSCTSPRSPASSWKKEIDGKGPPETKMAGAETCSYSRVG